MEITVHPMPQQTQMTVQTNNDLTSVSREASMATGVRMTEDGNFIFPLSSEQPYRRYYYSVGQELDEILSHANDAVDLDFLNSGNAPALDAHARFQIRNQIGVIVRAYLENERLYVEVKLSDRDDVAGIKADIMAGIIRNVSVGYDIHRYEIDEDNGTFTVTRWKPTEASFVPLPADETVGIGRSRNAGDTRESDIMEPTATATGEAQITPMPGGTSDTRQTEEQRGQAIETATNEIVALGQQHNMADIARNFVAGEMSRGAIPSLAAFRGVVRSNLPDGTPMVNNDIGLSESERQDFSITRLMRSMLEDASQTDIQGASFEREACVAAAENASRASAHGGMTLPTDLLNTWGRFRVDGQEYRGQQFRAPVSAGSVGGNTGNPNILTVDHLAERFIDALRNQSSFLAAGVTVLDGLDSVVEIPGADQLSQVVWLQSEDADAAETVPTFRKVTFNPFDVAGFTDLTRRMLQQSTIGIEAYVRMQLIDAVREAIDNVGLYGTGATGIPLGIANTTGIGSVTWAGTHPTRDEVIDLKTGIASTNRGRAVNQIGNSDLVGHFQKLRTDPGSGIFVMNDAADTLVGRPFIESNEVENADLFTGYWPDAILAMWDGLQLDRSTERKFLSGGVSFRVIQTVDVGVTRVGSFGMGAAA